MMSYWLGVHFFSGSFEYKIHQQPCVPLQGLKLELSTGDRVGLLSEVTRIFRENGLTVTRAEVSTKGNKAINTFYVCDTAGNSVELKTLEAIRQEIGQTVLQVKGHPDHQKSSQESPTRFLFSSLFRPRTPWNLGMKPERPNRRWLH